MKVEVDKLSSPFQCRKHWQGTEGAPTETATLTGQWLVKASVCGSARSPLAWWSPGRKRSSHLVGSSQERQQPYQSCSEASQLQWTVTVPYKWKEDLMNTMATRKRINASRNYKDRTTAADTALTGLWNQQSHQKQQPLLPLLHSCTTPRIVSRQQYALPACSSGNEAEDNGLTWSALSSQLETITDHSTVRYEYSA